MRPRPEFTLHDLLYNSLASTPEKAAVVDGDARYTYEDLERESSALGAALADSGVGKGDRVGVLLEKSWEAIVAMVASSRIGAAYVNVNPLFKEPQVEYLVGDCDTRVMIGDSQKLEELGPKTLQTAFYRGAKPEGHAAGSYVDVAEAMKGDGLKEDRKVSESDLGTILYTSGSTGMPKGVATSQRNLVVGAQIVSTYLENTRRGPHPLGTPPQLRRRDEPVHDLAAGRGCVVSTSLQVAGGPLESVTQARDHGRHRRAAVVGAPDPGRQVPQGEPPEAPAVHSQYRGKDPQANLDELRNLLEPSGTKIFLMYGLTEAFRSTYLAPEEIGAPPRSRATASARRYRTPRSW